MRLQLLSILLATVLTASAQPAKVVEANTDFALKLYAELSRDPGNVFFSPYNINHALAMALAGARGNTAREIAAALSIRENHDAYHAGFSALQNQLSAPGRPYQLFFAARLWGEKQYDFAPAFLALVAKHYGGGLEEVEFQRDAQNARKIINDWVASKTKDRIKDLLPSGSVNRDTRLVLTSAIYFKAAWATPFQTRQTTPGEFHLTAKQKISVPMMRRSFARLPYFSSQDMLGLELPYENNELSMVLLMPASIDGLPALEKSLTPAELNKRLAALRPHDTDLALPRFKTTREYSLNKVLRALGITAAFDPQKADFSGMLAGRSRGLFLGDAIHKAFIDVNEQGTEAAAATGLTMQTLSAYPHGKFHADRPFLYLIRESKTGSILFIGRVSDPR